MTNRSTVTLASNGRYWQACYYDAFGRRRKKGLGAKAELSRRKAKVLCDRFAAEIQMSPAKAAGAPAPRLQQYIEEYLASRSDLKPASKYQLELTGRYLVEFFGADLRIDRITRAMCSSWRIALAKSDLKAARKNHQYHSLNETSVARRSCDAKVIFNYAVRNDLIPFNPFDRLKSRPPEPDKDWYYLTLPDLEKLLNACPSTGWKMLIALCRLAGLRRGEAVALPWSAVDWERRRLTVFATKTDSKRIVPIEPALYAKLLAAFEEAADGQQQVCNISTHCLWRNFNVIRKAAALPAWDDAFQVLRRNCETDWAQLYPQYAVSTWIGHDITVSARHYLQVPADLYDKLAAGGSLPSAPCTPHRRSPK